jgi:hypothetical protein
MEIVDRDVEQVEIVSMPMASTLSRLVHWLVDVLAISIITVALLGIAETMGLKPVVVYGASSPIEVGSFAVGPMHLAVIQFFYYLISEGIFSRTLGKLVTGAMVVNKEDGERPALWQIGVRSVSRLIPFEPVWYLFNLQGPHDYFSKTLTVERPGVESANQ